MNLRPGKLLRVFREDLSLRSKLLVTSLAIILIPFVALALFVTQKVAGIVEQRIAYSADQSFDQASAYLEYRLYNVLKVSHVLLVNTEINDILKRDLKGYDLRSQRVDMQTLTDLFFSYQDGVNINRIRLYVRDSLEYAQEKVNLLGMSQAEAARWYNALKASDSTYLWCPSEYLDADLEDSSNMLSLARWIFDLVDLHRRVGVLRIDITKAQVVGILARSSPSVDSITYVENSAGDIVAASDADALPRFAAWIHRIDAGDIGEDALRQVSAGTARALVKERSLDTTDWRIVTVIPVAGIEAQSAAIRNQLFLVIFVIAALAYFAAWWMSGSLTGRLSGIMAQMRAARSGGADTPGTLSLEKLPLPAGRDEIGELARTYDAMIDEIEMHIAREERTQRELKGAELKALQAQINPHFLYNTLDMIKWMSRRGMADEIEEVLNSLATFYRLSLSRGQEIIPVREELRHVELYARIQAMRFRGAIDFAIAVDESVKDCGILRVTLQPLVENAILHGINEKPDKRGHIRITGTLEAADAVLEVSDDGVGIDEGRRASLLDPSDTHRTGFGIRNIHERFRLYYGEPYGLSFQSTPGRGTTVRVRFAAARVNHHEPPQG